MMQTNIQGVWALGDIRNTPFKQAVVAAGDGCASPRHRPIPEAAQEH